MQALFLGSIGTIADTSELQREAFNDAFREHDLDWTWGRDAYREMLKSAGGKARIAAQGRAEGREVDAEAIHATKSRLFQEMLAAGRAKLRPGLTDLIEHSKTDGIPLGLVTTTSKANVDEMLDGLSLDRGAFAVIVTRRHVDAPKPAPDCYDYAATAVGAVTSDCVAVEDNADGVKSALAAGLRCYAWPNENTQGHDFDGATMAGRDIDAAVYGSRS